MIKIENLKYLKIIKDDQIEDSNLFGNKNRIKESKIRYSKKPIYIQKKEGSLYKKYNKKLSLEYEIKECHIKINKERRAIDLRRFKDVNKEEKSIILKFQKESSAFYISYKCLNKYLSKCLNLFTQKFTGDEVEIMIDIYDRYKFNNEEKKLINYLIKKY